MSQKQIKSAKKHTVKEVLQSIQWSVEGDKLILLSPITDEYITISLTAINQNGKTK
jgi:hypothetical protein